MQGRNSTIRIGAERFIELDKLLGEFSTQFANTPSLEVNAKIDWALEQIAQCLDLDRCTFWELMASGSEGRWTHQYTRAPFKDFP